MSERSKEPVLKTGVGLVLTVGSNPTLSAILLPPGALGGFLVSVLLAAGLPPCRVAAVAGSRPQAGACASAAGPPSCAPFGAERAHAAGTWNSLPAVGEGVG